MAVRVFHWDSSGHVTRAWQNFPFEFRTWALFSQIHFNLTQHIHIQNWCPLPSLLCSKLRTLRSSYFPLTLFSFTSFFSLSLRRSLPSFLFLAVGKQVHTPNSISKLHQLQRSTLFFSLSLSLNHSLLCEIEKKTLSFERNATLNDVIWFNFCVLIGF